MTKARKPKLPRAPLPKQTGGAHRVKTKVLDRKAKYREERRADDSYFWFGTRYPGQ